MIPRPLLSLTTPQILDEKDVPHLIAASDGCSYIIAEKTIGEEETDGVSSGVELTVVFVESGSIVEVKGTDVEVSGVSVEIFVVADALM